MRLGGKLKRGRIPSTVPLGVERRTLPIVNLSSIDARQAPCRYIHLHQISNQDIMQAHLPIQHIIHLKLKNKSSTNRLMNVMKQFVRQQKRNGRNLTSCSFNDSISIKTNLISSLSRKKMKKPSLNQFNHPLLSEQLSPVAILARHHGDHKHSKNDSLWRTVVRFFNKEEENEDESEEEEHRKIKEEAINFKKEAMNSQKQNQQMRSITWIGLWSNIALGGGKACIGVFGHSQAMLADAVHSFTDAISDAVTLWALHMMQLPHNAQYPYGHGKFETVGTFFVAITLAGAGIGMGSHSVASLIHGSTELGIPSTLALYGAVGSILVKELLYQVTYHIGKKNRSNLLVANAWHHRTDAISSVVALVGVAGARWGMPWLDPVAGLAVAVMIFKVGAEMGINAVKELTDCALDEGMLKYMQKLVKKVEGVVDHRKIRARKMGTYLLVDVEIQVDRLLSVSAAHQVAKRVRLTLLDEVPQVHEVLVHVDPEPPDEESSSLDKLMRPQSEIFEEVAAKVDLFPEVVGMSYMCCHYYARRLTVEVDVIFNNSNLSINEAQEVAKRIQKEIETIKDISHADVMLNLSLQSLPKEKEWLLYLKEQRRRQRRRSKALTSRSAVGDAEEEDATKIKKPTSPALPSMEASEYPIGRPGHIVFPPTTHE
jgi:cation diffusion facilitator family transporter